MLQLVPKQNYLQLGEDLYGHRDFYFGKVIRVNDLKGPEHCTSEELCPESGLQSCLNSCCESD